YVGTKKRPSPAGDGRFSGSLTGFPQDGAQFLLQFRRNVFRGIHLLVLYLGGDTAPGRPPPTAGGSFLFFFVVVVIRIKRHGCILKR
ncbi:hypothetical protein, partial [uncultured Bilophila sp.]|uniref:hypothetical protein n=1 Tax=uncultured Bilophila sp. TaxID=529385 RepID=UPI002594ECA3